MAVVESRVHMQQFWVEIFTMASTLLNQILELVPAVTLLNHCALDLTRAQTKLAQQLMTSSKQTTTLCLIKTKNRMTQATIHSKIEATILDATPKHHKAWQPWVDHFLPPGFNSFFPWTLKLGVVSTDLLPLFFSFFLFVSFFSVTPSICLGVFPCDYFVSLITG